MINCFPNTCIYHGIENDSPHLYTVTNTIASMANESIHSHGSQSNQTIDEWAEVVLSTTMSVP